MISVPLVQLPPPDGNYYSQTDRGKREKSRKGENLCCFVPLEGEREREREREHTLRAAAEKRI
jgi:hypothetical protein